jgi:hypothetical protein
VLAGTCGSDAWVRVNRALVRARIFMRRKHTEGRDARTAVLAVQAPRHTHTKLPACRVLATPQGHAPPWRWRVCASRCAGFEWRARACAPAPRRACSAGACSTRVWCTHPVDSRQHTRHPPCTLMHEPNRTQGEKAEGGGAGGAEVHRRAAPARPVLAASTHADAGMRRDRGALGLGAAAGASCSAAAWGLVAAATGHLNG